MNQQPIIVTEIPRSGAQMVSQVLQTSGALCDEAAISKIRETVVRPFLKGLDADLYGINTFPKLAECTRIACVVADSWRRQVEGIIATDGPWIYRGSDALMLWPVWKAAFPTARWVVCRRDDHGIVRSCIHTKYIHGPERDQQFWPTWLDKYKSCISSLNATCIEVFEIWPGRFINGHFDSIEQLVHNLDLAWDGVKVQDALVPVLWTNRVYSVEGVNNVAASN